MESIINYFRNAFIMPEEIAKGASQLNTFAKWTLDLCRNVIVVGAFQFLAKKSDSILIDTAAVISICALFVYLISYTRIVFRPFHFIENKKFGQLLNQWADRIFFWVISIAIVLLVETSVNELTKAQFG